MPTILPHVVVANQALHGNRKVRRPGVEARPLHASLSNYSTHPAFISGKITLRVGIVNENSSRYTE